MEVSTPGPGRGRAGNWCRAGSALCVRIGPRRAEAVRPVVRWCPHASLARTAIGVLTLVARFAATPYGRVNVPPRSARRDLGANGGGKDDGRQAQGGESRGRAPGLRGDRHRQEGALRGGGRGAVPGTGPQLRNEHGGSEGDGRVPRLVRGADGGDGGDGRVLGPGVRGAGRRGVRGPSGEPARHEAGERAQERRDGLPVDPAADEPRPAARRVPGAGRDLPAALVPAPARRARRPALARGAPRAEGAGADERAAGQRAERHHGG